MHIVNLLGQMPPPPINACASTETECETTLPRIRVLLVDDHRIVRDGLSGLLSQDRRIQIVGEATNGREAVEKVRDMVPDLVLMDVVMPEMDGRAATQIIKSEFPQVAVVGLSMFVDEQTRGQMLAAGACAHLGKDVDAALLLSTLIGCVK